MVQKRHAVDATYYLHTRLEDFFLNLDKLPLAFTFLAFTSRVPTTLASALNMATASVVHDSALSLIGHTPLIRLDKIAAAENLKCSLFAKVEGFSAGGSVKVCP